MTIRYVETDTPLIVTKRGKQIRRFNAIVTDGLSDSNSDVNIGITPKGTRYYRAIKPDKTWSSLYMRKSDGSEVMVDTYEIGNVKEARVENRNMYSVITSDRQIKQVKEGAEKVNYISKDHKVGWKSTYYVQDDAKITVSALFSKAQEFIKPIKKNNIFRKISKLFK